MFVQSLESLPPESHVMVGQHEILFAVDLIKEHFGDIKVCSCLLRRGLLILQEIVKDTEMTASQVKNCLLVLIQHNCVQAYSFPIPAAIGLAPKVIMNVMALFDNINHRFMKIAADDLGPQCEALLEGLFQHGRLTFEQLLERALSRKGLLDELEQLLKGISMLKEMTLRTRDYLVSFGECMSTRIFAAYLNKIGVKARQGMLVIEIPSLQALINLF